MNLRDSSYSPSTSGDLPIFPTGSIQIRALVLHLQYDRISFQLCSLFCYTCLPILYIPLHRLLHLKQNAIKQQRRKPPPTS
jgi:hypothetical protein